MTGRKRTVGQKGPGLRNRTEMEPEAPDEREGRKQTEKNAMALGTFTLSVQQL